MKLILILILSVFAFQLKAQDPHFSQFYSSSLQTNPAFAGAYERPEAAAGVRNQWPDLTRTFVTTIVSYNQYMNKLKGGIGAYFLSDTQTDGTIISNSLHLDYSPSFILGKDIVVKPAVEFALVHKKIDWDMLTFNDMIDPRYGFVYPTTPVTPVSSKVFFDLSAGLLVYQEFFDAGFSIHHVNKPNESFINSDASGSDLPIKYTFHGSVNIPVSENPDFYFSPGFMHEEQSDFRETIIKLGVKYDCLLLGIGFRKADAALFNIGYAGNRFRISYCYDHTTSELALVTGGAHEVFASYFILKESLKNSKPFLKHLAF